MPSTVIYFRDRPGDPWREWAARVGPPAASAASARALLASMIDDEGLARPAVRVGEGGRPLTRSHSPSRRPLRDNVQTLF